jgi:VanZ family protein
MLPLRFPMLWSALGWALVAAVVIGSLVPGQIVAGVHVNDKVMHASAYGVLMVWFSGFYRHAVYPVIAIVLIALGLTLDLLQLLTPSRTFDLYDVLTNTAGVVVGFVLSTVLLGGWCQRVEQRLLS